MPRDYLPTKDAEFLAFAKNFSTKITATPTAFGLVAAQRLTRILRLMFADR
ncbi:MAG: hypothetical protein QM754_10845 [Tepidisphaeraceae bacterium]